MEVQQTAGATLSATCIVILSATSDWDRGLSTTPNHRRFRKIEDVNKTALTQETSDVQHSISYHCRKSATGYNDQRPAMWSASHHQAATAASCCWVLCTFCSRSWRRAPGRWRCWRRRTGRISWGRHSRGSASTPGSWSGTRIAPGTLMFCQWCDTSLGINIPSRLIINSIINNSFQITLYLKIWALFSLARTGSNIRLSCLLFLPNWT